MMNGYDEKHHFDDEPQEGGFVRAFDAFRKPPPQPLFPPSSLRTKQEKKKELRTC